MMMVHPTGNFRAVVMLLTVAAIASITGSGCAGRPAIMKTPPPAEPFSLQSFHEAPDLSQKPVTSREIFRTAYASGHALRLATVVKPHYHESHVETVIVQSGGGTFTMDGRSHVIGEGDVLVIPKKKVHGFIPSEGKPCTVLSIFTPPFDGEDRIWIDEPKD